MEQNLPPTVKTEDFSKTLPPETTPGETLYSPIRQGMATNTLTKVRARIGVNTKIDPITETATIEHGGITVTIPNFNSLLSGLKTSTYRLLDALTVSLTKAGAKSPFVTLSLDEYMQKCGITDKKEARKQAKTDLEALFNARITYKGKGKRGPGQDFIDIRICEAKGIKNGIINFSFSGVLHNALVGYSVMPYPPQLWKLNAKRNPNSYYLLRKISELKYMNIGKKNENLIAVKTLLANAPFLPSYDEVMASDKHTTQRIIEPFERDMDALTDTLSWNYCHKKATPLTDDEAQNLSYAVFCELLIEVTWKAYPDQTARLQAKTERIAEAKKKRTRNPARKEEKGGVTVH